MINAKAIRSMREDRKLARREVALAVGFTEATISKAETDENMNATSELIAGLASFYDVSADFILGRKEATK